METGDALFRICGLGLLCAMGALLLKGKHSEFSFLLRIGIALMMGGALVLMAKILLERASPIVRDTMLAPYATVMIKALGIAMLCGTCSDICRDCGEQTMATGVEMAGNLSILGLCLPLIQEIFSYASNLLSAT